MFLLAAHLTGCVDVSCRKRPFLIRPLENTLIKLLKSLDFYNDEGRIKIAIGERSLSASGLHWQAPRVTASILTVAEERSSNTAPDVRGCAWWPGLLAYCCNITAQ